MCVCVCNHTHMCMYIYRYIYIYRYRYIHSKINIDMYIYIYTSNIYLYVLYSINSDALYPKAHLELCLVSNNFLHKRIQGSLEKWLITSLAQGSAYVSRVSCDARKRESETKKMQACNRSQGLIWKSQSKKPFEQQWYMYVTQT